MLLLQNYFSNLDKSLRPLISTKVNYKIFLACCLLIICESIPWSYRWAGNLSISQTWNLPRGFFAAVEYGGLWPFGTENLYYLGQIQAFLGVEGASINLGSGFELQRSLYAFFVKSLWFLHPIPAGITINVTLWMLICFCMQYIIKTFSPSPTAQAIGGIFVASGQGFLHSVGEISPHILGYGAHYLIFALACRLRIWQRTFVFADHLIVYATIGLLQLGYDSAWLILPILLPISFYSIFKETSAIKTKLFRLLSLLTVSFIPSLSFSMATSLLLKKGGVIYFLFQDVNSLLSFLKTYPLVLVEGILSYGPIILLGYFLAMGLALKQKNYGILYLCLASFFLFLSCSFLMIPVSGRGYVTFSFSASILLIATYGIYSLWDQHSLTKRAFVICLLFLYVSFNNSPLLSSSMGNNWILQGFSVGYINVFQHSNTYRSFECDAFS